MPTPTIETLRHLKNVGVFADVPSGSFGHAFKPFNLIYGFNGCGKTTLSRLFESISDTGLNSNLPDTAEFSFSLSDGSNPSNTSLSNAASRYIAVFNEDYVERTLTWKEGTARPIIYLGAEQADLARQLSALETDQSTATQEDTLRSSEWSSAGRALDSKCRDAARLIAEELNLGRRYTAANLKADYAAQSYDISSSIEETERRRLKDVVGRSDLPEKLRSAGPLSGGDSAHSAVSAALAAQVREIAIAALQRRKDALGWVEQGLALHESEQECLFCGSTLLGKRVDDLQQALATGFDDFAAQLDAAVRGARSFIDNCRAYKDAIATQSETLPSFKAPLSQARQNLIDSLDRAVSVATEWLAALDQKRQRPDDTPVALTLGVDSWDTEIKQLIGQLNEHVVENNLAIDNFSTEKANAAARLKAHYLADYQSSFDEVVEAEADTKAAHDRARAALAEIEAKIAGIRTQLRTHGPASTELNKLLESYLGHSHITLEADEEGYRICRDGRASRKPLSEGEKTAVAFCYFVTSLSSEGRKLKDLIVIIDDPISSLDARAMTHVVSMIRRKFANLSQLFVLTHNLDFMREMKKWLGKRHDNNLAELLFIETGMRNDGGRISKIIQMPKLIREYESEYHYLYSLMKSLADDPQASEKFAYLMPNAIRKVLDIFLAFKDPGASGLEPKVDKLLQNHPGLDGARVKAMERLAQLESHSESIGDVTTFSAYTLEQVADAARCLLEVMDAVDPLHKRAMDRLCRP